ncbi:hypothetical protein [Arthrobacter sp. AQ5-05]|uniref:hypothetical protein n=1 Tax=Arthrobacter sp. AQ5-05 TaxID=2184581 RepID=UPI0011BDCB19|nr:hypothetical protein [Arthrobacter sp. AQ5-05]
MTTTATLATAGLAALQQILASSTEGPEANPSAATVDEKLRLLAILTSMQKIHLDDVAHAVSSSPARAVFLALLTEDLARTAGRAQIVAAGKLEETEAHTLREEPLARLHEVHRDLEAFIGGTTSLPDDQRNTPGTKMLFKDATDLVKNQLHLSFAQAKRRIIVRDLLLPHAGFNGAVVRPQLGQLARVFNDGSADPHQVALAARRMLALQPGIDAQQDPVATAEALEQQLAESLAERNHSGTAQLLRRFLRNSTPARWNTARRRWKPTSGCGTRTSSHADSSGSSALTSGDMGCSRRYRTNCPIRGPHSVVTPHAPLETATGNRQGNMPLGNPSFRAFRPARFPRLRRRSPRGQPIPMCRKTSGSEPGLRTLDCPKPSKTRCPGCSSKPARLRRRPGNG